MQHRMSENMPEFKPGRMLEYVPDRMSEYMSVGRHDLCQIEFPNTVYAR